MSEDETEDDKPVAAEASSDAIIYGFFFIDDICGSNGVCYEAGVKITIVMVMYLLHFDYE